VWPARIEGGSRASGPDPARQAASDVALSAKHALDLGLDSRTFIEAHVHYVCETLFMRLRDTFYAVMDEEPARRPVTGYDRNAGIAAAMAGIAQFTAWAIAAIECSTHARPGTIARHYIDLMQKGLVNDVILCRAKLTEGDAREHR
jgi:hypothetical protein